MDNNNDFSIANLVAMAAHGMSTRDQHSRGDDLLLTGEGDGVRGDATTN